MHLFGSVLKESAGVSELGLLTYREMRLSEVSFKTVLRALRGVALWRGLTQHAPDLGTCPHHCTQMSQFFTLLELPPCPWWQYSHVCSVW